MSTPLPTLIRLYLSRLRPCPVSKYPGTHGKHYDLYTLGADGEPGGEGANADIGNRNIDD